MFVNLQNLMIGGWKREKEFAGRPGVSVSCWFTLGSVSASFRGTAR